jgi:hypothetical protein
MNAMEHINHPAAALGATIAGWLMWAGSFAIQAEPFLRVISLVLAITASIYAIRVWRKKLKE